MAAALLLCVCAAIYSHQQGWWDWNDLIVAPGSGQGTVSRFESDNGYYLNETEALDGYVEYYWDDGDVYKGEFTDGERTGTGVYLWANGDVYEGDFVAGELSGTGTLTWANGDVYEGDFVDGARTGQGTLTWGEESPSAGDVYEGDFVDGVRTGQGKYTWADGAVYEGEFTDGARSGEGTCTWPDGCRYTGSWADDQIDGDGTYYFPAGGGFHPDELWADGTLRDGGTLSLTRDGEPFAEGYWKDSRFYGTYTDTDGTEYTLPGT